MGVALLGQISQLSIRIGYGVLLRHFNYGSFSPLFFFPKGTDPEVRLLRRIAAPIILLVTFLSDVERGRCERGNKNTRERERVSERTDKHVRKIISSVEENGKEFARTHHHVTKLRGR